MEDMDKSFLRFLKKIFDTCDNDFNCLHVLMPLSITAEIGIGSIGCLLYVCNGYDAVLARMLKCMVLIAAFATYLVGFTYYLWSEKKSAMLESLVIGAAFILAFIRIPIPH